MTFVHLATTKSYPFHWDFFFMWESWQSIHHQITKARTSNGRKNSTNPRHYFLFRIWEKREHKRNLKSNLVFNSMKLNSRIRNFLKIVMLPKFSKSNDVARMRAQRTKTTAIASTCARKKILRNHPINSHTKYYVNLWFLTLLISEEFNLQ